MNMSTRPSKLSLTSSAMMHAQLEKISAIMPLICMFAGLVRDVPWKTWRVISSFRVDEIALMPFWLVQVPRMEQPRDARLKAIARPIPRDAPLITATLLSKSSSRARDLAAGGNINVVDILEVSWG